MIGRFKNQLNRVVDDSVQIAAEPADRFAQGRRRVRSGHQAVRGLLAGLSGGGRGTAAG